MGITVEIKPAADAEWARQLQQCPEPSQAAFWIGYDTDGCGCAVNGVIIVRWTPDRRTLPNASRWTEADVRLQLSRPETEASLPLPVVLYEPRSEWVFDERMRLDYQPAVARFELRSDNQIFCR